MFYLLFLWFKGDFLQIIQEGKSSNSGNIEVLSHAKRSQDVNEGDFRNFGATFCMIQDF